MEQTVFGYEELLVDQLAQQNEQGLYPVYFIPHPIRYRIIES